MPSAPPPPGTAFGRVRASRKGEGSPRRARPAAPVLIGLIVVAAGSAFAADRGDPSSVLPPRRPTEFAMPADVTETGSLRSGAVLAQAAQPAVPAPVSPSPKAVVDRASAALNAITTFSADFTQIGGDGRKLTGVMYLQRPGKLRFEYDKPSTVEIVSDGQTVLVRDRKSTNSDLYPISQTPLKFLTANRIDLAGQTTVTGVATDPDGIRISLEDTATIGGTSKITLTFDPEITTLKRWRVIDPQGLVTTVSLSDIEKNKTLDQKIFMLQYMRPLE